MVVIFAWERTLREPYFAWVVHRFPYNPAKQWNWQQRGEHFVISTTVDVVVVTLLLRLVGRQQARLMRTEERYRAVFEHASDGIGLVRACDGTLTDTNKTFAALLDRQNADLVGRNILELMREAEEMDGNTNRLERLLLGIDSGEVEHSIQTTSAGKLPVSISSSTCLTGDEKLILLIMRDLSERRRLEGEKQDMQQELFQKSKLASIGELSAGVAHEINNPLNCIINFAELLRKPSTQGDSDTGDTVDQKMVQGIIDEGQRIAKIVQNLLTFARRDSHDLAPVHLGEVIKSSMSLFARQFEIEGILVDIHVEPGLPVVIGDASRLRQVILNMISNARNALRDRALGSKRFTIKTQGIQRGLQRYVQMEFHDTGVGIAKQNLDKVFDPFFTTRRETGGTGLGLSVSFGIVQEYGGTISIDSDEGVSTRFVIEIPAVAVSVAERAYGQSFAG